MVVISNAAPNVAGRSILAEPLPGKCSALRDEILRGPPAERISRLGIRKFPHVQILDNAIRLLRVRRRRWKLTPCVKHLP